MSQVAEVRALVGRTLGDTALGTYRYGSAVAGGLKPASDVDLLVVTSRSLTGPERRDLVTGLLALSGSPVGARPVELTSVVRSQVRRWRYPPVADFQYGEWLRDDLAGGWLPPATSCSPWPGSGPRPRPA